MNEQDASGPFGGRLSQKEISAAVIGVGYVGLPLSYEMAKAGFEVVGIDDSEKVVRSVNAGENHIPEVLDVNLSKMVESGQLRITQSFKPIRDTDVISICVPTPLDDNKNPDTGFIEDVLERSRPYLHPGQLIVLESTTYPGTTQEVICPIVKEEGFEIGKDIHVAYSPERVDPGNRDFGLRNTPKVVGGVTSACTKTAARLYQEFLDGKIHAVSSPKVAEMTKLLENIFRIVNVSTMNELAQLADRMGLDIWEAIDAAATKPFGFMPFYPGPGVGGHCIPIDPFYLEWKAREHDFPTHFIELAGEINDEMPRYVADRAARLLNDREKTVKGSNILLVGIAYKADVDDTRESAAFDVAEELADWGADLRYHDPLVSEWPLLGDEQESVPIGPDSLSRFDLAIVTTAHSEIDYETLVEHAPLVYDTRNALDEYSEHDNVHRMGAP